MQLCNDSVQTGSSIRPWELVTPLLMKETTDLGKLIPLISAGTHTDTVCIHVLGCCMFPCGNRTLAKQCNEYKHTLKKKKNPSHTLFILKNSFSYITQSFLYCLISLLVVCFLTPTWLYVSLPVCTQKHIYM